MFKKSYSKRCRRTSEEDSESSSSESFSKPEVDNSSTIITKMANVYAERLMSDITLVVGGVEYPSHRLILCASSEVFQTMLMNSNWSESHKKRVDLTESPSSEAVFEDFLKYLYTGKIQLDYATVIPLVCLADKYNVKDLLRIGLDYMSRNVSTACKRNQVVSWFQFTHASGHLGVANLCEEFIKWNFEKVSTNIDFPNMELSNLLSFIQCNDLVIEDEMALFVCVDKWLNSQKEILLNSGESEENIHLHLDRYVQTLVPHIRFPMMTPKQLANLMLNSLALTHMEMVVNSIRKAMTYHKSSSDFSSLKSDPDFDPRVYTPRLYTTENFCASLKTPNISSLSEFNCSSLVFSSQRYMSEEEGDEQTDWSVDLYPKGVRIDKCLTVYQPSGAEVPGKKLRTIRLSVSTKVEKEVRVRLGILIEGYQDGFHHIRKIIIRNFFFSKTDQILNMDDILDYDELNGYKHQSNYIFTDDNSFNVKLVIVPLSKLCSLDCC